MAVSMGRLLLARHFDASAGFRQRGRALDAPAALARFLASQLATSAAAARSSRPALAAKLVKPAQFGSQLRHREAGHPIRLKEAIGALAAHHLDFAILASNLRL